MSCRRGQRPPGFWSRASRALRAARAYAGESEQSEHHLRRHPERREDVSTVYCELEDVPSEAGPLRSESRR